MGYVMSLWLVPKRIKCVLLIVSSTFPVKATFISGKELAKQAKLKFVQDSSETIDNKIQECKKRANEVGENENEAEVKRLKNN